MLKEMHMKEIGLTIWLKVLENMLILMGQNIKDNGNLINSMEKENKFDQIIQYMKANMKKVKSMEKVYLNGLMVHIIKANLNMII